MLHEDIFELQNLESKEVAIPLIIDMDIMASSRAVLLGGIATSLGTVGRGLMWVLYAVCRWGCSIIRKTTVAPLPVLT